VTSTADELLRSTSLTDRQTKQNPALVISRAHSEAVSSTSSFARQKRSATSVKQVWGRMLVLEAMMDL